MKINIAIDGPSAAGKSTIAKLLAKKLGYVHLDTGAMYRCTALKAKKEGIALDDEAGVCAMLWKTDITLTPEGEVFLDGENVSDAIRTDEISLAASAVSKMKKVREDLVARQQKMAEDKGFIMDGRDIGTVVLKDAEVKIFMTASAEARAMRRYLQNKEKGLPLSNVETIAEEIRQRDYEDTHRANSPLRKADDAVELDTSELTIDEVVAAMMRIVEPAIAGEKQG